MSFQMNAIARARMLVKDALVGEPRHSVTWKALTAALLALDLAETTAEERAV